MKLIGNKRCKVRYRERRKTFCTKRKEKEEEGRRNKERRSGGSGRARRREETFDFFHRRPFFPTLSSTTTDKAFRFGAEDLSCVDKNHVSLPRISPAAAGTVAMRAAKKIGCGRVVPLLELEGEVLIGSSTLFNHFQTCSSARPRAGLCCSSQLQLRHPSQANSPRRNPGCQSSQRCAREREKEREALLFCFPFFSRSSIEQKT